MKFERSIDHGIVTKKHLEFIFQSLIKISIEFRKFIQKPGNRNFLWVNLTPEYFRFQNSAILRFGQVCVSYFFLSSDNGFRFVYAELLYLREWVVSSLVRLHARTSAFFAVKPSFDLFLVTACTLFHPAVVNVWVFFFLQGVRKWKIERGFSRVTFSLLRHNLPLALENHRQQKIARILFAREKLSTRAKKNFCNRSGWEYELTKIIFQSTFPFITETTHEMIIFIPFDVALLKLSLSHRHVSMFLWFPW